MSAKRILITGCSRGLGLAMVEGFVEHGHLIAGCSRSKSAMASLQARFGDRHFFRATDLRDDRSVATFCQQSLKHFEVPDLVINNGSIINRTAPLWEISDSEFTELMAINVNGTANVIRHIVPAMIEQGSGVIINFSSGWGRSTSPDVAPYCASKYAIEGLTSALAQELPAGIATAPFNPGIINTEMLQASFGESASMYPSPQEWAEIAVPFLENLDASCNGRQLTCPGQ